MKLYLFLFYKFNNLGEPGILASVSSGESLSISAVNLPFPPMILALSARHLPLSVATLPAIATCLRRQSYHIFRSSARLFAMRITIAISSVDISLI